MKKTLLPLIALSLALPSMGVTARKGTYTITQSDGSTIEVIKIGDERRHIYITTDGIAVGRTSSAADFYYLTTSGLSTLKAHNAGERSHAEQTFLSENAAELSGQQILRSRASSRVKMQSATPSKKTGEVVNKGQARIPVLLVQYSDKKFLDSNPRSTFEKFFRDGSTSARQYFEDQSNGLFQPQFDVYGPYTLSGKRATYGGNDYWGNDKGVGTMVAQACIGLAGQIDFSKYDNDGDGECDTVIVLYAGEGEASSDVDESVWPCQWDLASSDYGKSLNYNSTKINRFAVFNELNVMSGAPKVEGIGTFCHEFSHCLGLPDFYDTQYTGHFGMASWSLMDSGSYNDDGYTPIGYSAYEKEFMGWLKIDDASENTNYALPLFNSGNAATDKAVKITNPADANEYYIIENRARQGWDTYIPADGLMISHVTYSQSAWDGNTVNDYDLQRMTLVPADDRARQGWDTYIPADGLMISHVTYSQSAWDGNTVNDYDLQRMTLVPADDELKLNRYTYGGETYYEPDEQSLLSDLWPYGNANELTDESTPSFSPNTGRTIGMPVTEMTRNNEPDEQSLLSDLWPYGNANELTDESTPSFSPNTGRTIGMPVTEMTRNSDGTISFWIAKSALPPVATPAVSGSNTPVVNGPDSFTAIWSPADDNDVTYTISFWIAKSALPPVATPAVSGSNTPVVNGPDSFTAIWSPADDNDVTYTLNVFEHRDIKYELALSTKFVKGGDYTKGWTTEGSAEFYTQTGGTTEAIKFGSTSKTGGVVTKSDIAIGDYDCATVTVNAKSFNNDTNVKLRISGLSGSTTLSSAEVTLEKTAKDYTVVLPKLSKNFKIKIETVAAKKRAYLYSAGIYLGDATAAAARSMKAPAVSGDQTDMTITGITDTQYLVKGLKPGVTYDYRVKAVPVDATLHSESPWSETVTVALSGSSIADTNADTADENAEYYTLQGLCINPSALTPGIYIRRQGTSTTKIYIK